MEREPALETAGWHALAGAALGLASFLVLIICDVGGFRSFLSGTPDGLQQVVTIVLTICAFMAVGAGISGYILSSLEHAPDH